MKKVKIIQTVLLSAFGLVGGFVAAEFDNQNGGMWGFLFMVIALAVVGYGSHIIVNKIEERGHVE